MSKSQNKNIKLLNEGQNRTSTFSLDPAEKIKAHALLSLLKHYVPGNTLLVFSFIINSELKAGLELDHTKKVQLILNCCV